MKVYETPLAAKVAARNLVHNEAIVHWTAMLEAIRPFIGKPKTLNQSGAISEKLRKALPADPNTADLNWWYTGSDYDIYVRFKVCLGVRDKHDPEHCTASYAEVSCRLAFVKDHAITEVCPVPHLRTDITEHEVLNWRDEQRAAQKALNDANGKLQEFGLYDQ